MKITYDYALKLATERHKGQKRWSGKDYIIHPIAVAETCDDEVLKILGVSHDLIEDTDTTIEELRELGYSERILIALDILTHKNEDSYLQYILKIAENPDAKCVKIQDIKHNMSDLKKGRLLDKYQMALYILFSHSR